VLELHRGKVGFPKLFSVKYDNY